MGLRKMRPANASIGVVAVLASLTLLGVSGDVASVKAYRNTEFCDSPRKTPVLQEMPLASDDLHEVATILTPPKKKQPLLTDVEPLDAEEAALFMDLPPQIQPADEASAREWESLKNQ